MAKLLGDHPLSQQERTARYRAIHPEAGKAWYRVNKQKCRESGRHRYAKLRITVLAHYGAKCSWPGCEIDDPDMLQIDHVNGGGRQHMRKVGVGVSFYKTIISENFPANYRILCANHNWKHKANLERERADRRER